ncbi:MAG TPA: gene transfer agent family protein [Allosphingosinicella sp.]|nr:gene transfer agent family protein [Allosphingosinicella sp.]
MSAARAAAGTRPNPARGEAALSVAGETLVLRPSFAALVAAEEELGPLFALVERAADGGLKLGEMAALFWHCVAERPAHCTRDQIGAAIAEAGLARTTPVLKVLLTQILQGASTGSA